MLLCLVLLANGIGAASASARVAVLGVESAHAVSQAAMPAPVPDCHDAEAGAAVVADPHASHPASSTTATPAEHAGHGDDCAQICLDACLQHCHALVVIAVPFALAVRHAALVPGTGSGLAAAPQLPLLRPPIV